MRLNDTTQEQVQGNGRGWWAMPLPLAIALVVFLFPYGAAAQDGGGEKPLGGAPLLAQRLAAGETLSVWAGGDGDGAELADHRFQPERGYGHVGGESGSLQGRLPLGGEPSWPAVWRDGIERYSWQVPRGRYAVELLLFESEVGTAERRVFDVSGENQPLFEGVDIAARVGDYTWLVLRASLSVYDGWLDLEFRPRSPGLPARISGLRVNRLDSRDTSDGRGLPTLELNALSMPRAVGLSWRLPATGRRWSSFGVFRGTTSEGPFEELAHSRVGVPWCIDRRVLPGHSYFYRVCAYDYDGRRGPLSDALEVRAVEPEALGLPVYRLEVEPQALVELLADRRGHDNVAARLSDGSERDYVLVRRDPGQPTHRKKSFYVTLDRERNRLFQGRRYLHLIADVTDPTLLERVVWTRVAEAERLATPAVRPVVLMVNDEYAGLYFDVEVVDRRFLRRSRLDRSGFLARLDVGGTEPSWAVAGRKVTKNGNVISLNLLSQELARVGSAQFDAYLRDRFYLDRFLTRRALAALRGRSSIFEEGLYALRDARNGRWEFFPQHTFTATDAEASLDARDASGPLAWLLGVGVPPSSAGGWGWSLLEPRALGLPAVRDRYVARVEELAASHEARFGGLVDDTFAAISRAARCDPFLWLGPSRLTAFERGPETLKSRQTARLLALSSVLKRVKAEVPVPLMINELSVADPSPWLELYNRSRDASVALSEYMLAGDPAGRNRFSLPARTVAPGESVVLKIPSDVGLPVDPSGGAVTLLARATSGKLGVVDSCFYGHSTPGHAYARRANDAGWNVTDVPTPGAENSTAVVTPLPYGFRHGLVEAPSKDLTVWVRPNWRQGRVGAAAATNVVLKYRQEGATEFAEVPLGWNDKLFRHEVNLAASPDRERTEYYFLASSPEGLEQVYPLVAPGLTLAIARRPEVFINEVLPRPGLAEGSPTEFIEIYNAGAQAVDLGGFYLSDARRQPTKWRIPTSTVVAPQDFVVFYATNQNAGRHTNFRLNNSGEFLGLFGRIEEGSLLIDRVSFRALLPGQSWGRATDGAKGFRMWRDPTPGARNMPKIPEEFLRKE